MSLKAGVNNYISGISSDPKTKATQLWQMLGSKVFFRLSCEKKGQHVCECGTHTEYPIEFTRLGFKCSAPKTRNLSEYPIPNLVKDYFP